MWFVVVFVLNYTHVELISTLSNSQLYEKLEVQPLWYSFITHVDKMKNRLKSKTIED